MSLKSCEDFMSAESSDLPSFGTIFFGDVEEKLAIDFCFANPDSAIFFSLNYYNETNVTKKYV